MLIVFGEEKVDVKLFTASVEKELGDVKRDQAAEDHWNKVGMSGTLAKT